jgi:hypothetical protein
MKKQPNKWTCYPTAVSILTGIPIQTIIETIGHDGSKELIEDGVSGCGFTGPEMSIALIKLGWTLTEILGNLQVPNYPNLDEIFAFLRRYSDNAIVSIALEGRDHALAWDVHNDILYDPRTGLKIGWDGLKIRSFEILIKRD